MNRAIRAFFVMADFWHDDFCHVGFLSRRISGMADIKTQVSIWIYTQRTCNQGTYASVYLRYMLGDHVFICIFPIF